MRHHHLLAITVLAILTACATDSARTIEVSSADHAGDTIALRVGDTLLLRLRSNPGTGYSWARGQAAADVVTLVDSSFAAPATTAVGAPGEQHFRFVGKTPGSATLALYYSRPWETGVAPGDSVLIDLKVTAK